MTTNIGRLILADSGLMASAASRLKAVLRRIADADAAYRAQLHLESLPDYLLRDMGMTADDVARIRRRQLPWWMP